jgi:aminoglycoside/choline kinase family phosphotransferase
VGASFRLALRYEGDHAGSPDTLVAKFPSADEATRHGGMRQQVYLREVRFYQEIAPRVGTRTAEAYVAEIDLDTGASVLLLEDLGPASQGDQLAGCSPDQAALALEQAALLHAPGCGDRALERLEWLNQREQLPRLVRILPRLFEGFRERYGSALEPEHVALGERLVESLDRYYGEQPRPWTVQHGDYRLDNMLFDAKGGAEPLAVLDWQTVMLGPGTLDVSYFLGAALPSQERRAHEADLVRHYHRALLAQGVAGYPWERCWEDYRRYAVAGYLMSVGASMSVGRTPRGDRMFVVMASRHAQHAEDLECLQLIAG